MDAPAQSEQPAIDARAISIALSSTDDDDVTTHAAHLTHMNITSHDVTINLHDSTPTGNLKARVLEKSIMDAIPGGEMFRQCQAFDKANDDGSMLALLANFLSNETFPPDKEAKIADAEAVLFITEAHIDPEYRGQGFSLLAVDKLIEKLGLGESGVALLLAAPLSYPASGAGVSEACEKLTEHWGRMGFETWSESNKAWLCLSTRKEDRPRIELVVPELFGGNVGL